MEGYSVLYISPDGSHSALVADLQQETGFRWTVLEAECQAELGGWPPVSAMASAPDHDAMLIRVPDPCPVADFATVILDFTRLHPDLLLFLLIDASRATLARNLSDISPCGLLFPELMTPAHMADRIRDDIDRRRLQRELHEANTFTSQVIGSAGEGIMVMDKTHHVKIWNRAMERLTGVASPFALGRDAREVMPTLADQDMANAVQRALWGETDPACDTHYCSRRTGRSGWLSATFGPHRDVDGHIIGVIGLVRDVTQRKEAELAIRHLAYHDPLTGLPNRRNFYERMAEALANADRYGHRFAMMAVDLDRFKSINDTHGHEVGDQLLRKFAERLGTLLRKGDLLARMGGDEFVLLLPKVVGEEDVAPVAAKIVEALATPFVIADEPVAMTASIGSAIYPDDGNGVHDLIRRADRAMYRAKEEGRNRYRRSV